MNSEINPPDAWAKLAAARRAVLTTRPTSLDESAPFGFAQRVASCAMALQRHRQLAWWTRWSLRAAGAATVAAALVALARAPESTAASSLLAAPALEIPGFSSL